MTQELSSLMDGELDTQGAERVIQACCASEGQKQTWYLYHAIGDAMRVGKLLGDSVRRDLIRAEDLPPPGSMAPGFLFGVGLAWWALGRLVVGFTWRDERVLAGLGVEQIAALLVLIVSLVLLVRALWPRSEYG